MNNIVKGVISIAVTAAIVYVGYKVVKKYKEKKSK